MISRIGKIFYFILSLVFTLILTDHGLMDKFVVHPYFYTQAEKADAADLAGNSQEDCTCDDVILMDLEDDGLKYPVLINSYNRLYENRKSGFCDTIWQPPKGS